MHFPAHYTFPLEAVRKLGSVVQVPVSFMQSVLLCLHATDGQSRDLLQSGPFLLAEVLRSSKSATIGLFGRMISVSSCPFVEDLS
jgi:hypothetical protein